MASNESIDKLVYAVIGVGGAASLGFHLATELAKNTDLSKGVSKLLLNDIDEKKVDLLVKDIEHCVPVEKKKDLGELAEQADVYLFTCAAKFGAQKDFHGIDRELRKKLFNANSKILFSDEMRAAFEGSKGLAVIFTNPPDYLAYFAPEILGWGRNQVVGFNHADTYRLRRTEAIKRLGNLAEAAYMIGDHSGNSFAHLPQEIYAALCALYSGNLKQAEAKIAEIAREVHRKGFRIFEVMGHSNANCVYPFAEVINAIQDGKSAVEMSYHIQIPDSMPEELLRELVEFCRETGMRVDGICTGVPVVFRKKNGVLRAEPAELFGKGHVVNDAVFATSPGAMQYSGRKNFFAVVANNAKEIITAKQYGKKHGGQPLLPTENTLLAVRNALTNTLLLYETKKDTYPGDPSILFTGGRSELECRAPETTAMAAGKNLLVTVSSEGTVQLWQTPYKSSLADLASSAKDEILLVAELKASKGIHYAALQGDDLYLAGARQIERRSISGRGSADRTLDADIWSILAHGSSVFCSCSNGQVKEFDTDLGEIAAYKTEGSSAKISKMQVVDFSGRQYVFGINDAGEIFIWKPGETEAKKGWHSQKPCFDVQVEPHEEENAVCIYYIGNDGKLEAEKFIPETARILESIHTDIQCSGVNEIQARGNEVYLISDRRIMSFLNKGTRNLDIALQDKFVTQTSHIAYKK